MRANVLILSAWLAATPLLAQQAPPAPGDDPLRDALFPPELVMRHQQAIGLTQEKKTYLREEIRKAQLRFTELQWLLQDAMESMRSLLEQTPAPEQPILGQLEKVLEAEREIKRTQISLMVRIKNKLTAEQQARLRELRTKHPTPAGVAPAPVPLPPQMPTPPPAPLL